MKKRRLTAVKRVLTCTFICLLFVGQTIYAQDGEEYPVGAPMEEEVSLIQVAVGSEAKGDGWGILKDNGEFWTIVPEIERVETDVKKAIYMNGTYLLKNNGNLIRFGLENKQVTDQVEDIVEGGSGDLLALREDSTLWKFKGIDPETSSEEVLELIDSDVKSVVEEGYLKIDGTVKQIWSVTEEIDEKAEYINEEGYYTENGTFYFWKNGSGTQKTCNLQIKGVRNGYGEEGFQYKVALTMDGEAWGVPDEEGDWSKAVLLGENAKILFGEDEYENVDWMDEEGNYYAYDKKIEISEENPLSRGLYMFAEYDDIYEILLYGKENGGNLLKNDDKVLDHVKEILCYSRKVESAIVLRTDGTIWSIGDVPTMLGSIAGTSDYKRGDVNEDGEVNIKDLQLILRGVCEKIELTERQIMIADVVEDGKVDIQDLRKELRFVCGKITEL